MSNTKRSPSTPSFPPRKVAKTGSNVDSETVFSAKRRVSWELSEEDVNSAIALMEADGLTEEEMKDNLRVFLYAKKIMRDAESVGRKRKFDCLLNPEIAMVSDDARWKLFEARERLKSIVLKEEVGENIGDEEASLFDDFVSAHPEWGPETSFVVFRDHPLLKDKPNAYVERIELSDGLCSMHAPFALQHYLVAMHSDEPVPMLDMAIYLRKHLSAKELHRLILDDEGGDSKMFLDSILAEDPHLNFIPLSGTDELEPFLMSFGPGLISRFEVEEAFDSNDWQHLGYKEIVSKGYHAMVLAGIRKEVNETRYLVQNWWRKKAFVEMDGEYLGACGAEVTFVQTPQMSMGSYPTNAHNHVECDMLDAQETFTSEM